MNRVQVLAMALGATLVGAFAGLRILDPLELKVAREAVFDEYQRLAPRPFQDLPIRIVDVDEASLAARGQWPWSRAELARLVERLQDLGAAVVVFDMVFAEPDRSQAATGPVETGLTAATIGGSQHSPLPGAAAPDVAFARAIADRPVVLGFGVQPGRDDRRPPRKTGFAHTGQDPKEALFHFQAATRNLPALDAAAAGVGAISLSPEDNLGVVRHVPLLWTDGRQIFPSLALEALRVAQGAATILIHGTPKPPAAVALIRVGDFDIPTTRAGEIRLRFTPETPERYVSAMRVLATEPDADLRRVIEGRLVLVGTSATGLLDARATPLGETVPGVSIQAQALEQILSGAHLLRPDWVDPLEVLATILIGLLIALTAIFNGPAVALILGGAIASATVTGSWLAFTRWGLLVDPVFPCLTGLALHFAITTFRYFAADRDKRFVRRAFAHYVAPSILAQIEKDPKALRLGGEERDITIMFVDIRNFTALSEQLTPTHVVEFLNRLLGRLSEDVIAEAGTIDKYIGDSIMAFWNAPIEVPDHQRRACRAALRMRETLNALNEADAFELRRRGYPVTEVAIGIGINAGPACVGNMGSESRFNYSAVGDTVNVASRIESTSKAIGFDIVVSDSVARDVADFAFLDAGFVELRGKTGKTRMHVLVGDERVAQSPEFLELHSLHQQLLDAMGHGRDKVIADRLRACRRFARQEAPSLLRFYDAMSHDIAGRTTSREKYAIE
ncbi:adenylate/guanylate cyclase domain-containing protein [Chelatococcus sp. SYSU_G07232]|uniref:Adenylate/guanylate cyclase domain-containing protein n=1 Tax=Chelatococcus albus TaxID=3047466 RepID=A0ABT7AKR8_9HYPH|nr:adenylate/guanylate cyclase domain-containing protein [Chelatococcus sp. SYSU_G07232]MDJ1159962.1 adenylate/guanylate cyclase domain-containing protein [Chelatococcus sp. SYSU_G07232]